MQVSIVTPVKYQDSKYSSFYVCYASLLGGSEYLNFFTSSRKPILLDYSPNLPRGYDIGAYCTAIKLIKPKVVVLPSADFSYSRTVKLVEASLEVFKLSQNLVGVVQGLDLDSLSKCYSFLRSRCSIIGLPSPLETVARREEIIRDLGIKEKVVYIEVYSNPYEEIPPNSTLGIYTSYPTRLAANLRKLGEFKPTPPPLDFSSSNLVEELITKNSKEYFELLNFKESSKIGRR